MASLEAVETVVATVADLGLLMTGWSRDPRRCLRLWPCTRCVPTRSNAGGSPQTNPAAHPGRTPRPDPAGRVGRAYGSEGWGFESLRAR